MSVVCKQAAFAADVWVLAASNSQKRVQAPFSYAHNRGPVA